MKTITAIIACLAITLAGAHAAMPGSVGSTTNVSVTKSLNSMPLAFTRNQGQWDDRVQFRANAGGATMWFASDGAYYQFTRAFESENNDLISDVDKGYGMMQDRHPDSVQSLMIKASFIGANPGTIPTGADMIEYKCNYFIGNDPNEWHTDVPNYSAVMYEDVYDGIDLKYYGNGKQMEYDFIVDPGADFSGIRIKYEGVESIHVNANGELVITTKWGEVVEQRPIIYQIENDDRIPVEGSYTQNGDNSFGFKLGNYNPALPMVIDPVLTYSTYLGGKGWDLGFDIAVDASGAAYVTGRTESTDFPTLNSYQGTNQGNTDVFVTKLGNSGNSLIYSTYLGGSDDDVGYNIAVDASGAKYVTGRTKSADFPTLNPYQGTLQGSAYDVFVTKLSDSGNSLVYSTYLGGSDDDVGYDISVDASGMMYVAGNTRSGDFPTFNPYQETYAGGGAGIANLIGDAFIAKISNTGLALIYSTFLGGDKYDGAYAIEVDNNGYAYVAGQTRSVNFPTLNAWDATFTGRSDGFITKLSVNGNELEYSTYLGGISGDEVRDIALDGSGCVYATGETYSSDFPAINAYDDTLTPGDDDAYVSKFSATGDQLIYSTFLGGSGSDGGGALDIDGSGRAFVSGWSSSHDFPTVDAYDSSANGYNDTYLAILSEGGNSLHYSTYLGGGDYEYGAGVEVDDFGNIYVTGYTSSTNFPTLNPYQGLFQGSTYDAFVIKISADPLPVQSVYLDIKPGSCPNPLNAKHQSGHGKAVLPVAILGTHDFDVHEIDPETILLEGISPLRWSYEDVSSPVDKDEDSCACAEDGPDGYEDLTIKFDRQAVVSALETVSKTPSDNAADLTKMNPSFGNTTNITSNHSGPPLRDNYVLRIEGQLEDGAAFEGYDCVVLMTKEDVTAKTMDEAPRALELIGNHPNPFNPVTQIRFFLPEAAHVKIDIYNILGQRIESLVNGILESGDHAVVWNGSNASSGIYFYRFKAGDYIENRKMLLLK